MNEFITLFADLWQLTREIWQDGVAGFGIGDMIIAFLIFVLFALARRMLARFTMWSLHKWLGKTRFTFDDIIYEVLEKPLQFLFLILGAFIAMNILSLEGVLKEIADKSLRTLIAVGIFWSFYALITPLSRLLDYLGDILTRELINWLITILHWGVILVGGATILQIWGIQIAPIIAGLGLFGVAVALGAQDLFKNLLAGVSILLEQKFRIGDWIEVADAVEGTVEHIGFRSTRIRRFDKVPVIVPNNMFSDRAVINHSQMTHRRIFWRIGLEYRTTAHQLKQIRADILAWIKQNPDFIDPPELPCFVFVDSFNDSSIDMMVYTFTRTTDWEEWLAHKQALALAIKACVEAAGTDFAFPSRSIYVDASDTLFANMSGK